MKLITYKQRGKLSWGAVRASADTLEPHPDLPVVDLSSHCDAPDLATAIRENRLQNIGDHIDKASTNLCIGDIELQRPIPAPEKIVCVGVNYANRNEEYKDDSDRPKFPSLFIRFPDSLVAHGEPLVRPPESEQLDYEGEIVIVIGRGGQRISEATAHEHIAGLSVMNEGTIRDWLRHGKFNVTQGKNFVGSGALGPWMVTSDACPDFTNLTVSTTVNGEQRQHDNTSRMAFGFAHLVSYISTFMLLKPGDLIATGTPTGAGARFDPPRWLKSGDEVVVTVDGVGTLRNKVG